MQLKTTKEIWDKIALSYEGDNQVKHAKLQTLRIQYETLKMHDDESIASYFLRIYEIVNCMKNLVEDIKEVTLVEKVLISLSTKFESKVSAIEEKQDIQTITMTQLHGILTTFEMRKGGPSDMREATFKALGREELNELGHSSEGKEEANFAKNLQRGSRRFRGKLPFKCFSCGRVSHYDAKFPHKDKLHRGKQSTKWNRKQAVNEAFEKFKSFKALVENESNRKIKFLRSDQGGEFTSDEFFDFCEEHGIKRQLSTARTPQQNGVVERMNIIVQQMARAMLDESGTPTTFWREAAFATITILNQENVRVNNTQTPHELWYGKTPTIKYFKFVGSKCYIKRSDEKIGKFETRAYEVILLGYSS
eukprot:PITA_31046